MFDALKSSRVSFVELKDPDYGIVDPSSQNRSFTRYESDTEIGGNARKPMYTMYRHIICKVQASRSIDTLSAI